MGDNEHICGFGGKYFKLKDYINHCSHLCIRDPRMNGVRGTDR
ncbi:hypothetical protein [Methanothermobacter sp.]|nr:hypothetical protein [Methanothermobacter sp.]MDI9615235.1 hypothetical protein [Methanothermobacter sp.]